VEVPATRRDLKSSAAPVAALVAGLTLVAFLFRMHAASESLAGDELFLYSIVHDRGLGKSLELIHDTESTPPLHFLLAWASDRIGTSPVWIRLPSVVLGTATVPLVYLLGARTVGRSAGLVGAALAALSPFAIVYGSEGRAYATLAFFAALSTLFLLNAVRSNETRWWIAFTLASSCALYTHYTAVFVIAAQVVWALAAYRGLWRSAVLSATAMLVLYLPWIPSFLVQRQDSAEQRIEEFGAPVTNGLVRVFPGEPFLPLADIPGRVWSVLLAVILASALAWISWTFWRRRERGWRPSKGLALIVVVAVAAPLGAWLYTLGPTSIFLPRNLISSFPAFCVLLAALLMALPAPARALAVTVTLLVVSVGAAKSTTADYRRPAFREVGRYLGNVMAPGQPIISELSKIDERGLRLYLPAGHRLVHAATGDEAAWRPAADDMPVFLVRPQGGLFVGLRRLAGPNSRYVLRGSRTFAGSVPIAVGRYSGTVEGTIKTTGGRSTLEWSLGHDIELAPGAARGALDEVTTEGDQTTIAGWAANPDATSPADWVLLFSGNRLVSANSAPWLRPDLVEAYGQSAINAGFRIVVDGSIARKPDLRVIAVSGERATELRPSNPDGRL
jgi:mannosyltransferase